MKQPTKQELDCYRLGAQGLMSDTEIARTLKLKHRTSAGLRMWRVHKWVIAQERKKGVKL